MDKEPPFPSSYSFFYLHVYTHIGVHDVHLWFCFGILNSIGLVTGQSSSWLGGLRRRRGRQDSLSCTLTDFRETSPPSPHPLSSPSPSPYLTGQFLELLPRADAKANPPIKASCLAKYIYWLGTYAMAAPWFPIFCYFFQPTVSPPSFVYAAFLGTLLLFTTFACNSYLHHICGKYPFYKAEVGR